MPSATFTEPRSEGAFAPPPHQDVEEKVATACRTPIALAALLLGGFSPRRLGPPAGRYREKRESDRPRKGKEVLVAHSVQEMNGHAMVTEVPMGASRNGKPGSPSSGPRVEAHPLERLRAGEITLEEYLDLKVDEATAHLAGLSPKKLESVKSELREKLAEDPKLASLVRQVARVRREPD